MQLRRPDDAEARLRAARARLAAAAAPELGDPEPTDAGIAELRGQRALAAGYRAERTLRDQANQRGRP
ncbi:MAG: hypothetical protein E6J91_09745 [Deltaproteobacteria bacterium]|nr:MAG: hypothetical protein E6J91_09745 [Deltaproteobacteria bacterium]